MEQSWPLQLCEAVLATADHLDRCRLYGPADACRDAMRRAVSIVPFVKEFERKPAVSISALQTLLQQWRAKADEEKEWYLSWTDSLEYCADALEALLLK